MALTVKKYLLLIIIFITIFSLSAEELKKNEKYLSPDGLSYFYFFEEGKVTTAFLWDHIAKKEIKLFSLELRYKLNNDCIVWYGGSFEIRIHTGSPGVYSIFYLFQKQTITSPIWFVVAVDKTGRFALLAQESVYIFDLIENKIVLNIKLPIEESAVTYLLIDIGSTYFDANGDLHIIYLDKNKSWKDFIIKKKKYNHSRL